MDREILSDLYYVFKVNCPAVGGKPRGFWQQHFGKNASTNVVTLISSSNWLVPWRVTKYIIRKLLDLSLANSSKIRGIDYYKKRVFGVVIIFMKYIWNDRWIFQKKNN